ncbi:unnamed protein product [Calypogeia fissa]
MAMAGGILKIGSFDHSIVVSKPSLFTHFSSSSPSSSCANSVGVSDYQFRSLNGLGASCVSASYGDGALSTSIEGSTLQKPLVQQRQQSNGRVCYRSSSGSLRLGRSGRRRVCVSCSSGEQQPATVSVSNGAEVAELPCLPFTPAEVFVPSSTKVLHLYEARFLALLEEVMGKYDNLFAHIVIEPMSPRSSDDESRGVASFLATYGCLARVEKVKRLEIGAEVTIRGIGRIKLLGLTQLEPFLKGTVISLKDEAPKDAQELGSALEELRTSLSTIQQLQIKLKVSHSPVLKSMLFAKELVSNEELLQTPLERALQWAETGEADEIAGSYQPSREERVSFAALQPVAGASAAEQHRLLQERLFAMEAMDTLQRLTRVKPFVQQTVASLAAKVSLQSLNL